LGVGDVGEDMVLQHVGEDGGALGATGRAESAAFAREGDEKLVGAAGALDAGEAVVRFILRLLNIVGCLLLKKLFLSAASG
jgi:hypothetical protein